MHLNFEPILGKINSNKTNSIDFFIFSTPFTVYTVHSKLLRQDAYLKRFKSKG